MLLLVYNLVILTKLSPTNEISESFMQKHENSLTSIASYLAMLMSTICYIIFHINSARLIRFNQEASPLVTFLALSDTSL
jgi:hypothetical protein